MTQKTKFLILKASTNAPASIFSSGWITNHVGCALASAGARPDWTITENCVGMTTAISDKGFVVRVYQLPRCLASEVALRKAVRFQKHLDEELGTLLDQYA